MRGTREPESAIARRHQAPLTLVPLRHLQGGKERGLASCMTAVPCGAVGCLRPGLAAGPVSLASHEPHPSTSHTGGMDKTVDKGRRSGRRVCEVAAAAPRRATSPTLPWPDSVRAGRE